MFTRAHLNDPGAVGEGHDVPLLPEEGRVRPLYHLELAELLHGVNLLGGLVTDLRGRKRKRGCVGLQTLIKCTRL